jgi:hypothetical protein
MITHDTLRTAALSDQPWTELDKLVRAELAAGRLTKAIYDEILSLDQTLREEPDYTENAEEAIGDTLDALVGFCRADRAYKNPPVLPSEDEIAKLPRWARVAFAARCARRGESAYRARWTDNPIHIYHVVDETIRATERMAASGRRSATQAARHQFTDTELEVLIRNVVLPAYDAAWHFDDLRVSSTETARTAAATARASTILDTSEATTGVIRRDFDHIASLAEWQKWTDDTPVSPEVFGPLWPEGPPKGWPRVTDALPRTKIALVLFPRERVADSIVEDEAVNLFNALNRYHIARSGVRLTLEQLRTLLPAYVPAEV